MTFLFVLVAALACSLALAAPAFAAGGTIYETADGTVTDDASAPISISYDISGDEATITKVVAKTDVAASYHVVIPETIEGKSVTAVGARAIFGYSNPDKMAVRDQNQQVKSVSFPKTVNFLEQRACAEIQNLTFVTFAEGSQLQEVGESAFWGDVKLEAVELPSTVRTIGSKAFGYCKFASLTLPATVATVGSEAFRNCAALADLYVYNPNTAFEDSQVLPAANAAVHGWKQSAGSSTAEALADSLGKAFVPFPVLGDYKVGDTAMAVTVTVTPGTAPTPALEGDAAAPSVTVTVKDSKGQDVVIDSSSYAVAYSDNTYADVAAGKTPKATVTGDGATAFGTATADIALLPAGQAADDDKLFTWAFDEGGTAAVAGLAAEGRAAAELSVPATVKKGDKDYAVTSVREGAFAGVQAAATAVTLPEGVTSIGADAFKGSSIKRAALPKSLATAGAAALEGLASAELADGTGAAAAVFAGASTLESVSFKGAGTVGEGAFACCAALSSLDLGAVTSIGASALSGCAALQHVDVPASVASIGGSRATYGLYPVPSISFAAASSYEPGNSLSGASVTDPNTWLKSVVLPGAMTGSSLTLQHCTALESVSITSSNMKSLANNAFWNCTSLTSVELPEGMTAIGDKAFMLCRSLSSLSLPESLTAIGADEGSVFQGCASLMSIVIPAGVEDICEDAFYGSSFESIYVLGPMTPLARAVNLHDWLVEEYFDPDDEDDWADGLEYAAEIGVIQGDSLVFSPLSFVEDAVIYGWDWDAAWDARTAAEAFDLDFVPFAVLGEYEYSDSVTIPANCEVEGVPEEVAFTKAGTAVEPVVEVMVGEETQRTLDSGDLAVSYADAEGNPVERLGAVGAYKVTVAGAKGSQVYGEYAAEVEVVKASLEGAEVEAADAVLPADGSAATTEVSVKVGGEDLVEGEDFEITYRNNAKAGAALATVTGKGNYEGKAYAAFTVAAAPEPEPEPGPEPAIELDEGENDVQGDSRFGTAAAIALKAFPGGAEAVVVANGFSFADALAASALAGALDAPIVTVNSDAMPNETLAAVRALGAAKAYVVGGTAVVSDSVAAQLEALTGSKITRVAGVDRYETALKIYEQGKGSWGDTCIVAYGQNFADAVSVSPYANAGKAPIFLTDGSTLSADVQAAVKGFKRVVIVGGTGVVSTGVESQLKSLVGDANVVRLWGQDRYETSKAIADWLVANAGFSYDNLAFATGAAASGGADALAGGVLQGRNGAVLLLTDTASVPKPVTDLATAQKGKVNSIVYFGGENAISADVRAAINKAFGWNADGTTATSAAASGALAVASASF